MPTKLSKITNFLYRAVRRTTAAGTELERPRESPRESTNAIGKERSTSKQLLAAPSDSSSLSEADQHLLDMAIDHWHGGNWGQLSMIPLQLIEAHPDRSILVLLSAAGKMQVGENATARQYINKAENWGCSKSLIAEILISGAHNNLARANILTGRRKAAQLHFERATSTNLGAPLKGFSSVMPKHEQVPKLERVLESIDNRTEPNERKICVALDSSVAPIGFLDCMGLAHTFSKHSTTQLSGRGITYDNCSGRIPVEIFYRPESKGDIGVLKQIFEDKQYEFGWLPQGKDLLALMQKIKNEGGTPAIIDGGANIGASAIWFAKRFESSVILAIEPDKDNCELLRNNCVGKPVRVFEGGLAESRKELFLQDPGESDWGYRLGNAGEIPVQCIAVGDVLKYCKENSLTPLILKLDIEGGEDAVFSGDSSWIEEIPVIIIELHDWLFPERSTSKNFIRALADSSFQLFTRGENLFCFNVDLLRPVHTN